MRGIAILLLLLCVGCGYKEYEKYASVLSERIVVDDKVYKFYMKGCFSGGKDYVLLMETGEMADNVEMIFQPSYLFSGPNGVERIEVAGTSYQVSGHETVEEYLEKNI